MQVTSWTFLRISGLGGYFCKEVRVIRGNSCSLGQLLLKASAVLSVLFIFLNLFLFIIYFNLLIVFLLCFVCGFSLITARACN